MRAGGGRPATAPVTRNGSDVGGNRGDTHYTLAHMRVLLNIQRSRIRAQHVHMRERMFLSFLPPSFSVVIFLSFSSSFSVLTIVLARARSSLTIFLFTLLLSDAVSLFLLFLSSPHRRSHTASPCLARYFSLSSLCYNVAASGARGIGGIAGLRSLSAALHGRRRDVRIMRRVQPVMRFAVLFAADASLSLHLSLRFSRCASNSICFKSHGKSINILNIAFLFVKTTR